MTVADSIDRDISAIQCDDWTVREFDPSLGARENRFQVVFNQSALDEIHLHGQGSNDIEVCGVLIGRGYRDSLGPYLLVENIIRGDGARTKATNVTFTAETWAHIQNVMDRDFADKKMIGWYHTHPGFGIFLSDMDIFICDNFFNLPWQIAFVYDPIGGDEGNFVWKCNRPTREPVLVEDDVTPVAANIPLIPTAEAMTGSDPVLAHTAVGSDEKIIELLIRVRRLERRQKATLMAMVFLTAFVIMWSVEFAPVSVYPPTAKPASQPAAQPLAASKENSTGSQSKPVIAPSIHGGPGGQKGLP